MDKQKQNINPTSEVLPMVALLITKSKITNKMKTKNKFSEDNFNATIGNTVLPAVIPFNGEWKLLQNEKPVGFINVLCILSNHAIVPLTFSDMIEENKGFFHTYLDYSFERNPVIYWTYMLECPL